MSADDKPEEVKISILPQDLRDFVTKDVQVLNSERIIGYNTYNNILAQEHRDINLASDNSDYYNVTVNFIMKRSTTSKSNTRKELPIQVYENSVAELEIKKQKKESEADEDNEPKVIMPNELSKVVVKKPAAVESEDQQELVQQQVSQTPIELTNEQIAAQLDNLTPDEALQLAEEAGVSGGPQAVSNLQLSSEINMDSSNNKTASKVQEEEKSIEQGFTEFN